MKLFHGTVERAEGPQKLRIGHHTFSRQLRWLMPVWKSDEVRYSTAALYSVKAGSWYWMSGPSRLANYDEFQRAQHRGNIRIIRGSVADIMLEDSHRWMFYDAEHQTAVVGDEIMLDTVALSGRRLSKCRRPALL